MNSGIYKITINNKIYIGSAINFKSRRRQHLHYLKNNKHQNKHLQRLFNKYGDIVIEKIESCKPSILIEREQFYIDTLNPEINILKVAGSRLGSKHTYQAKEKMKGRKMPIELKEKLRLINTGKKLNEEHKLKISKSCKKESLKYKINCLVCNTEKQTSEKNNKYCSRNCYYLSLKKNYASISL
jgi:group I intron endonuclease